METYDIYFKEGNDFANKGFSLKDKAKAIRMAEDMLAERKGYVKDFVGGTISVMCKETKEEVWSKPIEEVLLSSRICIHWRWRTDFHLVIRCVM